MPVVVENVEAENRATYNFNSSAESSQIGKSNYKSLQLTASGVEIEIEANSPTNNVAQFGVSNSNDK